MNGWILFFVCGLIDYIARKTKNKRTDIVNWLGKDWLQKIYDLADVYHCDNIDRVCEDFIEEAKIPDGIFDNVADCRCDTFSLGYCKSIQTFDQTGGTGKTNWYRGCADKDI